jgi:uncharacterized damage-inducible protein DinB
LNAKAFQHFYEYHFTENRKIWDSYIVSLPYEKFIQDENYSHGSAREQIIHLIDVDDVWVSELQGIEPFEPLPSADFDDRENIRTRLDDVEKKMRNYLAELQDGSLFEKPIKEPEEDKNLIVWQVLLHVVNHGTDHRAQLLRLLNDLGVKTESQDYIFYVYDHLQ